MLNFHNVFDSRLTTVAARLQKSCNPQDLALQLQAVMAISQLRRNELVFECFALLHCRGLSCAPNVPMRGFAGNKLSPATCIIAADIVGYPINTFQDTLLGNSRTVEVHFWPTLYIHRPGKFIQVSRLLLLRIEGLTLKANM